MRRVKQLLRDRSILFTVVVLLVMLVAPKPELPKNGVQKEVQPYVEGFEKWGQYFDPSYEVPELNIGIAPFTDFDVGLVSPNAIGICYFFTKPRTIVIKKSWWENATDVQREMVVYHELGHCALSRMHKEATGPWGKQISLMYPRIFDENLYNRHRGYYMDEMFNPW